MRKLICILLTFSLEVMGASSQDYFGRAQSVLEEFQGAPLISANWDGRYRPYLYSERKFNPLLTPAQSSAYAKTDFYSPKPINDSQFLLYGEELGKANNELLLFDADSQKLQKISHSAQTDLFWYESMCVSRGDDLISFPSRSGQSFFTLDSKQLKANALKSEKSIPNFSSCLWIDKTTILGLSENTKELMHCQLNADKINCQSSKALSTFLDATQFFTDKNGRPGVIGIKKGDTFRQAYLFSKEYNKTTLVKTPIKLMGDVLDVQEGHFRVGLHGRYVTDLTRAPAPNDIISRFKKIDDKWYAIAANPAHARTLAVLEKDAWKFLPYAPSQVAATHAPVEVITKSPSGKNYQSFLYGPLSNKKIVVWLHGGPHESFSPRFHPYVYALNEKGYSVLAVNYPGSTGRGLSYENATDTSFNIDCMQSIANYLKENDVDQILVWSVSYGDKLQKEMLEHNFPVSAIIDQVGIMPTGTLKKLAQEKSVPYFSIRGKHDTLSPADNADFIYEGGHDMTHYQDFDRLMYELTKNIS